MTETEQIDVSTSQQLVRPTQGRMLAGVAQGIAIRFALPVWLVRVIFVILTISGGVGLFLYIAGWVLIPEEGRQAAAGQILERMEGPRAWVGVGLIALAVIIVADTIGLGDADLVTAAVLIVVGVLLYRGDLGGSKEPSTEEATATMTYTTSGGTTTEPINSGITDPGGPADAPPLPPVPPVPAAARPPLPPPPPRERSILGRLTIAVGLITLGIMALFDNLDLANVTFRHYVAAAMTVIGVGLLVGSMLGRARGLIVLGVILAPVVLFSPISEFDFGETSVRYDPVSLDDIQTEYQLDVGTMIIDLSAVDFAGGEATIDADVGLGELIITVPDDVAVEAYGNVGVGELQVFGSNSGGIGDIGLRRSTDGDNGTLIVNGRTDMGRVEIRTASGIAPVPPVDFGGGEFVATVADDLESSYDFGVGDYVFDLSDLTMSEAEDISIDLGTGTVTVILPAATATEVEASVGLGDISFPDDPSVGGIAPSGEYRTGDNPLLSIDIEVGAGEIVIEEAMR